MKIVNGDILKVGRGGIICHQVNCKKVAGAGLALQIRNQISGWYGHFRRINGSLGEVDYFHVGDTVIASLYAQEGFGRFGEYTSYNALRECLRKVSEYASARELQVYIPYRIGCGLGGGDWDYVYAIIMSAIPNAIIMKLED